MSITSRLLFWRTSQVDYEFLATSVSVVVLGYALASVLKVVRRIRKDRLFRSSKFRTDYANIALEVKPGVEHTEDSRHVPDYDVVVVGGGTAGCVLAARISEDPSIRVLLLEAGRSGLENRATKIPAVGGLIFHSKDDFDLYTTQQPNAGGKSRYWPRAKLLGGCTTINAMMFHAGAPTDYDEWVQPELEGSSAWSYANFSKYFLKFEKFVPHKQFPSVDASLRGSDGPVEIGYFGYYSEFSKKFMNACVNVGIKRNPDINTFNGTSGVTKVMTYISNKGVRVTTETAYLTSDVLSRPNLTIATYAQVTRILFDKNPDTGKLRACGVEFAQSSAGPRFRVAAKKEVVMAAGAVHTPQIMMVSGLGPAEHLKSHNLPVLVDLPGVGQNLKDHMTLNLRFRVKPGHSIMFLRAKPIPGPKLIFSVFQYWYSGSGPLTQNIGEVAAFVRSFDPKLFPPSENRETIEDTTSGPEAPDLEIISSPVAWADHGAGWVPKGDLCSISATCLRPVSTGSITLKTGNPFDAPMIDPKYLDSQHDLDVLVRGVKLICRVARTEPLYSALVKDETDPFLDHFLHETDDAHIEKEVRKRVETLYHPTSTARMAPLKDGGVVDAYLRVYGVDGLRIADASVFPKIMAGHTAAPVIAVAEKASDLIKESIVKH